MSGRVVILGSVNVDVIVSAERLPGAGETVHGEQVRRYLGGKGANQAVGVAKAGGESVLLAAVGSDGEGIQMLNTLEDFGVDVSRVRKVQQPTGCALVVTSPQDNQIVVVPGANAMAGADLAGSVDFNSGDICLAQRETSAAGVAAIFRVARANGAVTILNAAPADEEVRRLLPLTDVLVVNESEFRVLCGIGEEIVLSDEVLRCNSPRLGLGSTGFVVVTLGSRGVAIVERGDVRRIAAMRTQVVDTTGAGDCFCGYLAAGLALGQPLDMAATTANMAAAISIGTLGAANSIPDRSAVTARGHLTEQHDGGGVEHR